MPKVYIAGPMRGYPQFNFPTFDAARRLGESLGWEVISPADMDREHGIDEKTARAVPANGGDPEWVRVFIRRDVDVLVNTLKAEKGDAIALLPGWEKSTGASGELAIAKWAKLRVLDAVTFKDDPQHVGKFLAEVFSEAARASRQHPPMKSVHEGLAIMWEEFEEVKLEVFKKVPDYQNLQKELVQLAAMCGRFAADVVAQRPEVQHAALPAQFRPCVGGACGWEHDLATTSTIAIADDFANRKEI